MNELKGKLEGFKAKNSSGSYLSVRFFHKLFNYLTKPDDYEENDTLEKIKATDLTNSENI